MSSLKMTFSLTSLIFLIALGLVFVPTAVMAHDADTAATPPIPEGHVHVDAPTVDPPALVDLMTADGSTVMDPEVTLVQDPTADPIVAIDLAGTTAGVFQVKLTFSEPVYDDAASTGNTVGNLDITTDLTITAASRAAPGINLYDGTAVTAAVARMADDAMTTDVDESLNTFIVTFTVDRATIGSTDTNSPVATKLPVDVWVTVNADALTTRNGRLIDGVEHYGMGNTASERKRFIIAGSFDETAPMVTIASDLDNGQALPDTGVVIFTITSDEGLGTDLTADKITVTGGTKGDFEKTTGMEQWTIEVTPDTPTNPPTNVVVTIAASDLADVVGNEPDDDATASYTPPLPADETPPTVMVEAPDANGLNADGEAVFTITFSEALSTARYAEFTIDDIEITGGSAMAADLDGPTDGTAAANGDVEQIYMLSVTPDAGDGTITVTITNEIDDMAGNPIDIANSTASASMVIDMTPPEVVSFSFMEATAPAGATGNYLAFTFTFSEEIDIDTFTVNSIDQGNSHNLGVLSSAYFPPTDVSGTAIDPAAPTAVYAANSYMIVVPVRDIAVETTIVLKIGSGAIEDMYGNAMDPSYTATAGPDNTAPVFEAWVDRPSLTWCEGVPISQVLLPLARDNEGDKLTYELLDEDGDVQVEVPESAATPPAMGLYWVNVDAEQRYLRGTTQTSDEGTYTWRVTDQHGLPNVTPLTFTITVDEYVEPGKVMMVEAAKVNSEATAGDDVNRVRLTWTDDNPTTYPNNDNDTPLNLNDDTGCIALVTHYIINRQALSSHTRGRRPIADDPENGPTSITVRVADVTTTGNSREYTTDKLTTGTYEFTVTAVNRAGNSDASDKAVWKDVTDYHWIIVNDPPHWNRQQNPANLRANQTEQPAHSVTLDWRPPTSDTGAPVDDTDMALRAALYGPNVTTPFGGYHLEVTDQRTGMIRYHPGTTTEPDGTVTPGTLTRPDTPDDLLPGNERTFNIAGLQVGEYTVRVVSHNIAGKSLLSENLDFEIDVYQPVDEEPVTGPNNAPNFDGTVSKLTATEGTLFLANLPEAEDADGDSLTYSVSASDNSSLPAGLSLNGNAIQGTPSAAADAKVYIYKVVDGNGGSDQINFILEVMAKEAAPAIPDTRMPSGVDFTSATVAGVTTLTLTETTPLGVGGFGIVEGYGNSVLPDIQRFFAQGGTISVLGATGSTAKDVVVSEIMWGLNLQVTGAARTAHQFVELYNTTSGSVNLSGIEIVFDPANMVPAVPTGKVLLDQVSNVDGLGWLITDAPGQSGSLGSSAPQDLVSMYRNINYDRVKSTTLNKDDAADNRKKQLEGVPNGSDISKWVASNAANTFGVNLIGSPGAQHFVAYTPLTATNVPRDTFIINEVGNYSDDKYDWVEIKRVGSVLTNDGNLKKWRLSQVTDDKKDTALVTFPENDNHKIPNVNDVLLIVNSDPYQDPDHPLAAGDRINGGHDLPTGVKSRYYVDSGLKLKNSGKTLLILRNSNDNNHLRKSNNIQDVIGTLSITDNAAGFRTKLWPLVATAAPHGNVVDGTDDEDLRSGKVYRRANAGGGTGEKHLATVGYTGVGYKRSAANSGQNGGTPGYNNDAVKVNESELTAGAGGLISISEIMYTKDRNLPQWIELYNSSKTQAINLNEWKLKIDHSRNVTDVDIRFPTMTTNNLGGTIIQPNQTVLIVSDTIGRVSRAGQGNVDFPATRVISLWATQKDKLEIAAGATRRDYKLLSEDAFRITLMDKGGTAVDVAGNLGADGTKMWDLPTNGTTEGRSSIIRRYNKGKTTEGGGGLAMDGTLKVWNDGGNPGGMPGDAGWIYAAASTLSRVRFNETYYGAPDDIGTPGFRAGGPLPVSLSSFRPERLKETGEIVVRWTVESELNNAGFNILRSDKRDGEYTKVHYEAGRGTTSERKVYEWKDTTATKPNVVYYYQIQDVSLDGEVTTLRVTHLRGNVTAAGKATTTWGQIKALQ